MRLPKAMLDEVKWYETAYKEYYNGWCTVITLHFSKWWKRRKVLTIYWTPTSKKGGLIYYTESVESRLLRQQLYDHFKER